MEPSQLQRVLLAVASTSFTNSPDNKATVNKFSDGDLEKQVFQLKRKPKKKSNATTTATTVSSRHLQRGISLQQ